ncbi:hypothetical protein WJX72_005877 [[Myrmecia] bisecta]|uniref:Uncharacterized protein n=1 Tax=[Myrmecia] bisecta TaxID=41462 RepID=A0AAW1R6R2_9CHLO
MFRSVFDGGSDPFEHFNTVFRQMNDQLFSDPFFAVGPLPRHHRQVPVHSGYGHHHHEPHHNHHGEGPSIEEAEDHEVSGFHAHTVEEPDDEEGPRHGDQGRARVATYSYRSSSWSGGPGGMHFSKETSARYGPGGVAEHHETVRDGRSGREHSTSSRHLGDRGYNTTRARHADGRHDHRTHLHNMREHESASAHWLECRPDFLWVAEAGFTMAGGWEAIDLSASWQVVGP